MDGRAVRSGECNGLGGSGGSKVIGRTVVRELGLENLGLVRGGELQGIPNERVALWTRGEALIAP